jgi:hypothetical protein
VSRVLKDRVVITLAVLLVALILVELLFAPHYPALFPWHGLPGYSALIGFGGALVIVFLSKALGGWGLQRPELDDD